MGSRVEIPMAEMSKIEGLASRCVEIKLRAKVRAEANQSSQTITMRIDVICLYTSIYCSFSSSFYGKWEP